MDCLIQYEKFASAQIKRGKYEPDFFEIIRRFAFHYPDLPRPGRGKQPEEDIVRFSQKPLLAFPENAVTGIQKNPTDGKPLITETFFGLLGSNGPLPLAFTEFVIQRTQNHYDPVMQRFLDIINHRFLTLFYRAWEQSDMAASHDRPGDDQVNKIACSMAGVLPHLSMNEPAVNMYLSYSPYTSCSRSSRIGLQQFLGDFTGLPVKVQPFCATRMTISPEFRCRLGNRNSSVLGQNIQIGSHYCSDTKRYRIIFGPMSYQNYQKLMPGSPYSQCLNRMIAMYVFRPLQYETVYRVRTENLPEGRLNKKNALNRNFWLGRKDSGRPAEITVRIEANRHFDADLPPQPETAPQTI